MTTNVEGNDHRSRRAGGRVAVAVTLAVLLGAGLASEAGAAGLCERADARLEATGRGDRDFDGLSNCRERRIVGTSPRDDDSDDDGVEDGEEIENGTDPMDSDSDDDGLDDGEEAELGTDPEDPDSDDDGLDDGDDPDPTNELDDEIEGDLDAISCAGGTLTVLGVVIGLTSETEYDGVESCEDLEGRFVANGGAHVEVDVTGDLGSGFVAEEVDLEDADNDGSPDNVDDDDDNDGVDDDEDEDDDDDDVDDEEDDDDDND